MHTATAGATAVGDTFWWQGARMRILARAGDTGGALGVVEARFPKGFGPPLHVHRREDEALHVISGEVRFRQGDRDFTEGAGGFVWTPRGVPHAFRVLSDEAHVLVLVSPGGFERMFEEAGVPVRDLAEEPPVTEYDPEAARAVAGRFGFEVVGPQLEP
jgi:quercetin dioxygenase-like cupin family protein